jgi:predicted esterase
MIDLLTNTEIEKRGRSRDLVVLLHGWIVGPQSFANIRQAVAECMPDADILSPSYPHSAISNADPYTVAANISAAIDAAYNAHLDASAEPYNRIILIGHSLGANLLRKAYVFARGQTQDHPLGPAYRSKRWADRVERIVLLAGTNRGWETSPRPHHMSWTTARWMDALNIIGRVIRLGKLIRSNRRGAPFVADLRLQWLDLVAEGRDKLPLIVQLLGDIDDQVSHADNSDLKCCGEFYFLEVPNTAHLNVVDFSGRSGEARKRLFVRALTASPLELESMNALETLRRDHGVRDAVMVMHGIRDFGHWTARVSQEIAKWATKNGVLVPVVMSSYGYFPMARFLLSVERQKNVRWFVDQYTELRALYPRARIGFVGHSNGTYLLASALERYRACHFHRAVFAGSVVRTDFPWDRFVAERRIDGIANFVATNDLVVGVFPAFFERIGIGDLGGAGHNGFLDNEGRRFSITYLKGGHSAAIRDELFPSMVSFLLEGRTLTVPPALDAKRQEALAVVMSKLNWLVWILLGAAALLMILAPVLIGAPNWWALILSATLVFFLIAFLSTV